MKKQHLNTIFYVGIIALAIAATGCNSYQRALKGADYEKKFEIALKLYNKKDYQKAYPLFEELVSVTRVTSKAEDVYYHYAWCNYYLDDLVSSSYHFEQFASMFPTSKRAEEAAYMAAYCYYLGSPAYSLDQTNSLKAIEQMQLFINRFPHSTRIQECNDLIDKLRAKLERKSFESGMLFFKTMDYKAAIISLKNTLKDYPLTGYKEEILFTILKANFLLAENSVQEKKSERYKLTLEAYSNFIDKFAVGKYAKEAATINAKANNRYQSLQTANTSFK
ncbi:MAG: outer membrane protein assembly factor BamD [Bacteroidia bacterium]|nr:outer membrane protein assembly factor BamD [Bacteroidia bacterium]